jgi:hypothetical protein
MKKEGRMLIIQNTKLFIIIILLIILVFFLIYFIKPYKNVSENECNSDEDCVPACGCHPDFCTPISKKTDCEKIFCTAECAGPLDCGAGYCTCINNKCQIGSNE